MIGIRWGEGEWMNCWNFLTWMLSNLHTPESQRCRSFSAIFSQMWTVEVPQKLKVKHWSANEKVAVQDACTLAKNTHPFTQENPTSPQAWANKWAQAPLWKKHQNREATQDSRPNGLEWAKGKFRKLCWAYWKAHGESRAKSRQNASQDARRRFQMGQAK